MVCLGNICRSPLAEGILRHKIEKAGLSAQVDSAGTGGWHAGEGPDQRSVQKGMEYGIDISRQRARQFKKSDFDEFDLIYAMDGSNYSDIIAQADNREDMDKVKMILNEIYPGEDRPVPDPYYGGEEGFENVYRLLDEACDKILKYID